MGAESGIADRIAPIYQPLLFVSVHGLEPRRDLRQICRIACRALEGVVQQFVIQVVCTDAPIASSVIAPQIALDKRAFA